MQHDITRIVVLQATNRGFDRFAATGGGKIGLYVLISTYETAGALISIRAMYTAQFSARSIGDPRHARFGLWFCAAKRTTSSSSRTAVEQGRRTCSSETEREVAMTGPKRMAEQGEN